MPPPLRCRSSALISQITLSLPASTMRIPKWRAMPARGRRDAPSARIGRGRRKQADELLRNQFIPGGGEVDAVVGAQALGEAVTVLAIGGEAALVVRDGGPQRHELCPEACHLLGVYIVDIAHIVGIFGASGDRV